MSEGMMSNKSRHQPIIWDSTGNPAAVVAAMEWAGIFIFGAILLSDLTKSGNLEKTANAANQKLAVETQEELWKQYEKKWPEAKSLTEFSSISSVYEKLSNIKSSVKALPEGAQNDLEIIADFNRYCSRGPWGVALAEARSNGSPDESDVEALGEAILALEAKSAMALRKMGLPPIARPSKISEASKASITSKSSSAPTFGGPSASMTKSANVSSSSISSAGSPEVETAQKILTALGFDTKGIDGKIGNNTRSAILAFQKKNGLPATGNLDSATMAKLRSMAPASLAASLGGESKGMSTGMKIGLAVAGVAAVGGLAYYFLSDDEDEVEG